MVTTVKFMTARTDIVICEPLRTPVGRMGGALAQLTATELATVALEELVRRTGLGEGDVDDVILGNGYANGEAPAIGRVAALDAGLGTGVPGLQIDRRCGSGLQAVLYGAAQVATGAARLVVAGGAESMSNVEHYAPACAPASGRAASSSWTASTAPARPSAAPPTRCPAA